ncbi:MULTISPECIES: ABC transporter substrate-binding protein [Chroococcidiopsis]|jgi:NitT/TauT family transport system substrate-binding protein|uniref:ABC transporter, nitrate-like substrate binding protein n=1 Tax=Chroococcidiopsis thermalis (strain PCC 7203) TaxID=251229 RepID=K9U663_CHRTP|nr:MULTISPECIES: ABC transporter substrate-binding protein [Chroococcidiopsis]AFY90123.1 ABC transporter, nitrate-like substrate binding protein [Chroococcidiopsis thermalis PCC 7203]PSB43008.1 thiamine biosynthesis protein [Cyanosarcina cf. burmensis CCALA 770]URD49522.1 ABC transporter substrate-binding protein [Chroococcidiopsis sp. CCNUC1]
MVKFPARRLIVLALISLLWAVACSPQTSTTSSSSPSSPTPQPQVLISGINPWPGYSGHYVALQKDFFSQEGIKVQETFFQSATEGITAFLAGKVDVGWVTSGDAVQMISKDPSIRMFYVVDYSNGSDGILGHNINSPKDMKGKTVARENILFEKVLLRSYLEKGGLTEQDAIVRDLTAADAAAAFAAKRVDAAVSYEPWLTKAAKESGGKIIFTTKDTNLIADVLVVRQKLIESRKADLQAYVRAIDKGVKLVNSGDEEAIKIAAQKLGVTPEEAKEQIAGVKIFDLDSNKSIAFNLNHPNNAMKNFELTARAAYDFKIVPKPLELKSLYDDSIVKST